MNLMNLLKNIKAMFNMVIGMDTKVNLYQRHLRRKLEQVSEAFNSEVGILYKSPILKDLNIPEFEFRDLDIISDWSKGLKSSLEVCEVFDIVNKDEMAHNKILKKIDRFYQSLDKEMLDSSAEIMLRGCITMLSKTAVPSYKKYLDQLHLFFIRLKDLDKQQVPLIYGKQIENSFVWKEMTFDQALRFIKGNKIDLGGASVYNEFQIQLNGAKEWLLCPTKEYASKLKIILDIRSMTFQGDQKEWIKTIESQMRIS